MNLVNIIGQLEGDADIVYESKNGEKRLYKFTIKVPKSFKNKDGEILDDYINVKAWSSIVEDDGILHDQAVVGVEGRIQSFANNDMSAYYNEVVANRILYLN
ncbi:single-stranded DNA-binding protein [[Acholeplasma] multilocale]|uniref:single-stranded DNA-binding protein n=1 Tax=[Acholeplasma] multilocale TaxID=264638 RepID=UPI00047E88EF|nr:single-stranded DNA-binding protein [[Acholeplasma] multilocale]